jgi:hypothetical protein
MLPYYDRQGKPITAEQWSALRTSEYKRVAETTIGPLWVSTVWLGIDHGFEIRGRKHRPVIFETMIFPADGQVVKDSRRDDEAKIVAALHPELRGLIDNQWRYCTEAEAIAGHDGVCVDIRILMSNIAMAEQVMREAIDRVKESP